MVDGGRRLAAENKLVGERWPVAEADAGREDVRASGGWRQGGFKGVFGGD